MLTGIGYRANKSMLVSALWVAKPSGFMAQIRPSSSRRKWLLRSLQAGITVTAGAVLYPVLRFLRPRAATSSGALQVVAPYRVHELKPNAQGQWPPPFDFGGKPCLLIRTLEGEIRAFNAVCTHVDCTVEFSPAFDNMTGNG